MNIKNTLRLLFSKKFEYLRVGCKLSQGYDLVEEHLWYFAKRTMYLLLLVTAATSSICGSILIYAQAQANSWIGAVSVVFVGMMLVGWILVVGCRFFELRRGHWTRSLQFFADTETVLNCFNYDCLDSLTDKGNTTYECVFTNSFKSNNVPRPVECQVRGVLESFIKDAKRVDHRPEVADRYKKRVKSILEAGQRLGILSSGITLKELYASVQVDQKQQEVCVPSQSTAPTSS